MEIVDSNQSSNQDSDIGNQDIINKNDLAIIIAELSENSETLSLLLQQDEYTDINTMCDSTQEMKQEFPRSSGENEVENLLLCSQFNVNTNIRTSTCKHLNIDDYPGPFDFSVSLAQSTYKRGSLVYSSKLRKVFIDAGKIMLIKFKVSPDCPLGLQVRALLVYMVPDHMNYAVKRCTLHTFDSDPNHSAHTRQDVCMCQDYNLVGHILTTDNANATYEYNPKSERHSVLIPLGLPEPGSDTITATYQFGCKTSCPGGMSRRPIKVIYTLETPNGDVIGRQSMSVKVCSCPKRDKEREEIDYDGGRLPKRHISPFSSNDSNFPTGKNNNVKRIKLENIDRLSQTLPAVVHELRKIHNEMKKLQERVRQLIQSIDVPNNNTTITKKTGPF